ncbi:hypothetical protein, partial [Marinobacter sp. UBA5687]|uniref:hypothetical protein n=1 Tax=Marinobacter sp. UBA5687 TaxID=1946823 RepID=UPI002597F67E
CALLFGHPWPKTSQGKPPHLRHHALVIAYRDTLVTHFMGGFPFSFFGHCFIGFSVVVFG